MVKQTARCSGLVLVLLLAVACGAPGSTGAGIKQLRTTAYDAELDVVWAAVIDSLRDDYPVVRVLDKEKRKIVTCWKPVDRDENSGTTSIAGAWRLFRGTIEISAEKPYRVSVAGMAAELIVPVIRPYKEGDVAEPGWREPRTSRIAETIHDHLKQYAKATTQEMPPPANPDKEETYNDTCITRPELLGIEVRGMRGIPIGDAGAMRNSTPQ